MDSESSLARSLKMVRVSFLPLIRTMYDRWHYKAKQSRSGTRMVARRVNRRTNVFLSISPIGITVFLSTTRVKSRLRLARRRSAELASPLREVASNIS